MSDDSDWGEGSSSPPRGGFGRGRRPARYERTGGNDRFGEDEKVGGGNRSVDDKPKLKENYIPPEPSNDEKDVFSGGISSGIHFDKYDTIHIKVTGESVPAPINTFEECGLRDLILQNVMKCGYKKPTPVQKQSIPIITEGRDLMACAQTGSGKTAAFLVPIINTLMTEMESFKYEDGVDENGYSARPQAVIVSPTRELTLQIFYETRKFCHNSRIKSCVVYGGTTVYLQAQRILGCNLLVATPGRLIHFVEKGYVSFSSVKFFVLDEADRMLDMGFLPSVEKILEHETMVPVGKRQTMMFSATFPEEIQRLAAKYLCNYLFLTVGIVGGACTDVEQRVYEVGKFNKRNKLVEILTESEGKELTLVFVETKRNADFLAAYLSENDFPTTSIHGDRLQSQREQALADFKSGRMPILVATAVAARGLDIKNVAHVINYDLPSSIDEYVHRIGRTGRVGNRGKATSFYDSHQDQSLVAGLVKILQQADQDVPPFLMSDVTTAGSFYPSSRNDSNYDVRKSDNNCSFGNNYNQPQELEEEEEW